MIQYQQATIEFTFPPSEPFVEQVGLVPRPIRRQTTTSPIPADGVLHFNVYAHLVSIDPAKNRYRFYTLTWQAALFDGLALVRCWGRIGTSGQSRAIFFGTREGAQKTVEETLKRRLTHGYQAVRWE